VGAPTRRRRSTCPARWCDACALVLSPSLLSLPDLQSREQILRIHSRKMNLMRGINLKKIASQLGNANGAECKAVCTEAGMFALRERRIHVTQEDFEMACAKVMKKDSEKDMSVIALFK
jgi:26S proteasome regulatory subunit T6